MPDKKKPKAAITVTMNLADPRDTDVLLGRGNGIANYPGNLMFREVVSEHRKAYECAYRCEKQRVAHEVINQISKFDPPGRFIELTKEGTYILVPFEKVLEKTCQALREKKYRSLNPDNLEKELVTIAPMPSMRKNRKETTKTNARNIRKETTKTSATNIRKKTTKTSARNNKVTPSDETKTQDVAEKPTENAKKRAGVAVRSSRRVASSRKKRAKTSHSARATPRASECKAITPPDKFESKPNMSVNGSSTSVPSIKSPAASKFLYFNSKRPPHALTEEADKECDGYTEEPSVTSNQSKHYEDDLTDKECNGNNSKQREVLCPKVLFGGSPKLPPAIQRQGANIHEDLPQFNSMLPNDPLDFFEDQHTQVLADIDMTFSLLPPQLTAFFSGIFSTPSVTSSTSTVNERSMNNYVAQKFGKSVEEPHARFAGGFDVEFEDRLCLESPTTVVDDHIPGAPPLEYSHSLLQKFGKSFEEPHARFAGGFDMEFEDRLCLESPTTVVDDQIPAAPPLESTQSSHSLFLDNHHELTHEDIEFSPYEAWKEWSSKKSME
jgi:hypothetical protein